MRVPIHLNGTCPATLARPLTPCQGLTGRTGPIILSGNFPILPSGQVVMPPQMTTAPLILTLLPARSPAQRMARDVALMAGFSLIVALSARISIPLGFTPVPVTAQTLAVLLAGAVLGSKRGAGAMILYLIEGAWLPVFATGIGPVWELASGGYIIGFIPAAYVVGLLCERGWDRRVWIMLAMLAGNALIYIPGLIQLSFFVPEGKVLEYGLYPFIAGDLVKLYFASLLVPAAWLLVSRWRGAGAPWS